MRTGRGLILLKKKGLLALLAAVLVVSLFPPAVFADFATKGSLQVPTLRTDQEVQYYLAGGGDGIDGIDGINGINGISGKGGFGKSSALDLPRLFKKNVDAAGRSHYIYQQTYQGIPVYGRYANVTVDASSRLRSVKNEFLPEPHAALTATSPSISGDQAIAALLASVQAETGYVINRTADWGDVETYTSDAELMIYPLGYKTYLTYEVKLSYVLPQAGSWVGYVDALTGEVIDKYSKLQHLRSENAAVGSGSGYQEWYTDLKVYYDADGEADETPYYYLIDTTKAMFNPLDVSDPVMEGVIWTLQVEDEEWITDVISETPEFDNPDAVDAHYNTGAAYDFYLHTFGRDSFDGRGATVTSVVYFPEMADNAAYLEGVDLLVYGTSSGTANDGMDCISCSQDIVVHEYTHAVTAYTAGLEYRNQPGALSESISDIMAAVADHDGDEWLIGEETGTPVRDMADPTAYDQKAHMDDYNWLSPDYKDDDNGGVHINSGIPNHAAYLIATGLDSKSMDGRAILGWITYQALTNYLNPTSDFQDARDAFLLAAADYEEAALSADDSFEADSVISAVEQAWAAVGLPAGRYNQYHIKSFEAADVESGRPAIIDDLNQVVYFFVPYGTDVSAVTPDIATSAGTDYEPKGPLNFNNEDRGVLIMVSDDDYYSEWAVIAVEEPILQASSLTFTESDANDGTITGEIMVDLVNTNFNGLVNEDFISSGKAYVSNLPDGLQASVKLISATRVGIALSGKAAAHANANDIANLDVTFLDQALTNNDSLFGFRAWQILNNPMRLMIDFNDPPSTGGGGFGGGFIFIPPTTELKVDPATGVQLTPPDGAVTTNPDGQTALTIELSEGDVKKGFELLADASTGTPQTVTIAVTQSSDLLEVKLPAASLLAGASASSDAKLVITTGTASYELPVTLLDVEQLAASLGVKVEELTVAVKLNQVSPDTAQALSESAANSKLQLVGPAIDFAIEVSGGGKQMAVSDFGRTYVERSITVPGELSVSQATVLRYEPATGHFSFVPARFQAEGGKTKVTFKRNGNSIYTVARFTRVFSDVSAHWAKADIEFLASKTIISGYTDTAFAPNRTITRAEFAAILTRALALTEAGASAPFSDVISGSWYEGAVAAASNAKLVSGFSDGTFRPGETITREQMAVMIANALTFAQRAAVASQSDIDADASSVTVTEADADVPLTTFTDAAAISPWARGAVAAAVEASIISGFSDGSFQPAKNATRAEAAVMIRRLLDKLGFLP